MRTNLKRFRQRKGLSIVEAASLLNINAVLYQYMEVGLTMRKGILRRLRRIMREYKRTRF